MVGRHHQLNGHGFEQTLGDSGGQRSLRLMQSMGLGRVRHLTAEPQQHHFPCYKFIIARTWKQPRCPLADEWIRKLWYIYTMEYYSAIKKIHLNQF